MKKKMNEDAKIIAELGDFKPWSGAVATWEKIKDADMLEDLDILIEEMYPDGIGMTELNDLLWFEDEWVLEQLGLIETEDEEEYDESFNENLQQEYDEIIKRGRMPLIVIDTAEQSHEIYFEPQGDKLVFGGATNTGIIPTWEFDYDDSQSFDWNFQGMVEEIQQELWDEEGYPVEESFKSSRKSSKKMNENEEVKSAIALYKKQGFLDTEDEEDARAIEVLKNADYTVKVNSRGTAHVIELERMGESLKSSRRRKSVNEDFGVEYRNMHDGIHRLLITDTEEHARDVLDNLKQLENAEDEDTIMFARDDISRWVKEEIEINYRDVDDNGMYGDIQVINYDEPKPDIYESLRPSRRRKSVNENRNYRGLTDIEFIWHGANSDPELIYKGKSFNYYDVENALYDMCKEDIEEGYFKGDANNDEDFERWLQENEGSVYGMLDDWMSYGESLKPSRRRRKSVNEISDELVDKVGQARAKELGNAQKAFIRKKMNVKAKSMQPGTRVIKDTNPDDLEPQRTRLQKAQSKAANHLRLRGARNRRQEESLSSQLLKSAHSVLSMNEGASDDMTTWSFKAKGLCKSALNKQSTFGAGNIRCIVHENLNGKLEGTAITDYAMPKSQVEEALKNALRQNGFRTTSISSLEVLY